MALNIGYLTSDTTKEGDSLFTPYYAVDHIIKYLPKDKIIWCPFATAYFCRDLLPKDLIVEKLVTYERPLGE